MHSYNPKAPSRGLAALIATAAMGLALAGCDVNKALSVDSPSRIPAGTLETPANAALLVNGAVSDFECAFGAYVVVGGLVGEELDDYTQTASRWDYDRRTVQSNQSMYSVNACDGLGVYTPLQTARVTANHIRTLLEGWSDADIPAGTSRQVLIATAAAYEAWSILLLGEGFCSTALTTISGSTFAYAGETTRNDTFKAAEDRFNEAITVAQAQGSAASSILNMALVGRARARQDQGNIAGARTDAALIPATFVFNATASAISSRRNNRVFVESNSLGVSSSVGARYRTMNDPRVPVQNLNRPNALGVPAWAQLKYTAVSSSIPMATGDEAQLIIAEADASSNSANTISIINAFRAKGNEGTYTGPTDATSLLNEVIDQRRRALFLTGTHIGDIMRYKLTLTPATGTNFPAGSTYGSQTCVGDTRIGLPLPDVERQNNPKLGGSGD
jgi:hypothetical protein